KRMAVADMLLSDMARKVHDAGRPLLLVVAPSQLQVALLTSTNRRPAVDAGAIDARLREIAARNDIEFLATLGDFRGIKAPSQVFYPVDGHLNGDGHAILTNAI